MTAPNTPPGDCAAGEAGDRERARAGGAGGPADGGPRMIRGERVPPAEAARFAALVALQDPSTAARRLDDFARWIFGGTTVVGALLIGLASTGVAPTRGAGQVAHALAIVSLGVSLALASASLAPKWTGFNPHSDAQRERAVADGIAARRTPLAWAARAFAAALVAAGVTPLVATCDARRPRAALGYTLTDSGPMTATLTGAGLPTGSVVELFVAAPRRSPAADSARATTRDTATAPHYHPIALPRARAVVGPDGSASVSIALRDPPAVAADSILLVGASHVRVDTVAVPVARPAGARPAAPPVGRASARGVPSSKNDDMREAAGASRLARPGGRRRLAPGT